MDKPTFAFTNSWLVLSALFISAASNCFAQYEGEVIDSSVMDTGRRSGSYFNRQLGTAFRFGYQTETYGIQKGFVTLGSMKVVNLDGATFNMDAQATLSDGFGGGYNAGIFYRALKDLGIGPDSQRVYGIGFWSDGQSTSADNFFNQLGFTLESLGESYDLRFQGNFPLERREDGDRSQVIGADPVFEGNFLMSDVFEFRRDTALTTIDFEGAKRIMNYEAWAFLGGYHLSGGAFDATGYKAGVRGYAVPDLELALQVTEDDLFDTNVSFRLTWFVGRTTARNQPCGNILDRFREPVNRNNYIATVQRTLRDAENPFTDAVSGDEFFFVHVDSSAAEGGDGTFENPYNDPNEVNNGSAEGNIILAHADSTFTGNFVLQDDQRLLGEGVDPNGNQVDHIINTAEDGLVVIPETDPNAKNGMAPIINALVGNGAVDPNGDPDPNNGISAIQLADDNEVNNFQINANAGGTDFAVNANGVNAPQLANLDINGPFGVGVGLTEVTGSSVVENSVTINDTTNAGIRVTGGSSTVGANATITNSLGNSVIVENREGGTVTVGEIADTGEGVSVRNNDAGDITFSSLADLDTGADQSVTLFNNNGASITFQELQANSDAADTFVVRGGGNITVNNTQGDDGSDIVNTGAGSAVVVQGNEDPNSGLDGSATVTIAGDVVNSGGGFATDIQEMNGGGVTISGNVSDPNGDGMGLLVQNNSGGNFSFTGETRLNTGDNTAATFRNNNGATVGITDLQATSNDADTFRVVGGGAITVSDPNDNGFITNTGTGAGLVVLGADDPNATGNPDVIVSADINNTGGSHAVFVDAMSDGSVDINGDVTATGQDGPGIFVGNSSGATVSFDGETMLDTGAFTGVDLASNSGSTITFNNLMATSSDADTFIVRGGGAITVNSDPNNPGFITNTGTASAVVVIGPADPNIGASGNPVLTINTDVNNGGGGSVVTVDNLTGGLVDINGDVSDPNGDGLGISVFDNADAIVSFDGLTTLDTGAQNAVFLSDNSGSTISFNNLMATSSDADTFVVRGGGAITVNNDPNNPGFINNTGTGSAVVVVGPGDPNNAVTGNPVLVINTDVNNGGGGAAVLVNDLTGGLVDINGDIMDPNGDGLGIDVSDNADAIINFDGLTSLDTGTSTAVLLFNNSGSAISFENLMATSTDSTTFVALGGGTISVGDDPNNPGFITNTGTGSAVSVLGDNDPNSSLVVGNPDVTIDVDVSNGGGGSAVNIFDMASGSVDINGDVTDPNQDGLGISISNNSGATISFDGNTQLDTGSEAAVFLSDNSGSTISFNNLNATSSNTVATFGVIGGGNISVSDPNGTGLINNTGTGSAVVVVGDDDPNALAIDDPNVVIDVDITNSGGGSAVAVTDMTGGRVTINGQVNDTADGLFITDNSNGADIEFLDTVTVNTSTLNAIELLNNSGANITFDSFDLTVSGTGEGFTATGGGNLTVLNTNGTTIQQNGTGTALRLSDMTIAAAGAEFDVVNVPGGTADAIVLENLGGTGQVVVGSGTDPNDGGQITTTGTAIRVDNVNDLAVNNIRIANTTGPGVNVTNQTAGSSASFSGLDIDTTDGDGITVEGNADGTIAFTDVTVDATGTGRAVYNSSNNSATVSYTELTANSGTGDTFTIEGGGDISVLDSGNGSTITNTGSGSALVVTGANGPGIGNPTATIAGDVSNTSGGRSVDISDLTGGSVTVSGEVSDDSLGVLIEDNTSGSVTFSNTVTLNTGAANALTIQNNGAANTVSFDNASQLDIDTTSGTGIVILDSGTVSILGSGNTIDTTAGIGIDIDDTSSVTIENTEINAATLSAIDIDHNSANSMDVTLNDVTISSSGGTAVDILADGSGELDVTMDTINISVGDVDGIALDTGASANRVDLTITGQSSVTVGDASAFQATLNDSDTADVRMLVRGTGGFQQQFDSTSATEAAFDVQVDSDMTVSATIGLGPSTTDPNDPTDLDPPTAPIGDSNRFRNQLGGDAFVFSNNANGTVNLDLRDNTATSAGGLEFDLFNSVGGTFNLVDRDETILGNNNAGTVTDTGTINDIMPPLLQPTP